MLSAITSDMTYLLLALLGSTIFLFGCIAILINWRVGVFAVLGMLLIEDVVRRLLYSFGLVPEIALIKDALLALTYLAFFTTVILQERRTPQSYPFPFMLGFFGYLFIIVIGSINFLANYWLTNFPLVLLSFRVTFWYMPLIFLGYELFRDEKHLERFCYVLVYLSIPLTLFATVQFFFGDQIDSPLMKPLEGTVDTRSFLTEEGRYGNVPRATSVFGTPLRFGTFSLLLFILGMALQSTRSKINIPLFVAIIASAIGVLLSSQRIAMLLLIVAFFWVVLNAYHVTRSARNYFPYIWMAIIIASTTVVFLTTVEEVRLWLWTAFESSDRRSDWFIRDSLDGIREAGLLGLGLGVKGAGSGYIDIDHSIVQINESGIAAVTLELGLIGLLVLALLVGQIIWGLKQVIYHSPSRLQRALAVSVYIFFGCILLWSMFIHRRSFYDSTALIMLWLLLGLVFRPVEQESNNSHSLPSALASHGRIHAVQRSTAGNMRR
jgi:cell division protein FtsW (lipid II flippase)